MMKIRVTSVTDLPLQHACFDLYEDFGLTCLIEQGETVTLLLNGHECRSWRQTDYPHLHYVRWFAPTEVIAWFGKDFQATLIAADRWRELAIGYPDDLFLSKTYMFVGYDIETKESSGPSRA
jgi:hypothetical protein